MLAICHCQTRRASNRHNQMRQRKTEAKSVYPIVAASDETLWYAQPSRVHGVGK